jgi:hypothetical protein
MAADVRGASLTALAAGVAAKTWKARDLVEAYLDRIARLDKKLGCFLLVDGDGARKKADAIDKKIAAGESVGPLGGVPIGLKDIFVTCGIETTAGSKILKGFIPPYESTASARLAAAGAINLGKLNMDEFAMGSSNENSAYHPVHNPWDLERVPGRVAVPGHAGYGHRRFDSPAGLFVRDCWREANLRPGFPLRCDRLCLVAGSPWAVWPHGGGRRGATGSDRGS